MTSYVLGFLFYGDAVVLIKKNRPEWQAGKWNGVGGHVEPGETPLEAMIREFKEETGIYLTGWRKFAVLTDHVVNPEWDVYCFRAEDPIAWYARSQTDEVVSIFPVNSIRDTIANIPFLVKMADPVNEPNWPFLVMENCPVVS